MRGEEELEAFPLVLRTDLIRRAFGITLLLSPLTSLLICGHLSFALKFNILLYRIAVPVTGSFRFYDCILELDSA